MSHALRANEARANAINLHDYFMHFAILTSKLSSLKEGACIVNENNRIVGLGYSTECSNEKSESCIAKGSYTSVMDAILKTNSHDVKGCTIHLTEYPSPEKTKLIIQSGIKKIFYIKKENDGVDSDKAVYKMLQHADVAIWPYVKDQDSDDPFNLKNSKKHYKSKNKADTPIFELIEYFQKFISHYFMAIALLAQQRAKDPITAVGACIVDKDHKIVFGIGYNGMPNGCKDKDFPWNKKEKFNYVCHAELNAICNSKSKDLTDCTMYVTVCPCKYCAL